METPRTCVVEDCRPERRGVDQRSSGPERHGAEAKLVVPAGWDETPGDPPTDVAKIAKAQDVLRKAIRKAIEDEAFRAVFESEESIRARWPLEEPAAE